MKFFKWQGFSSRNRIQVIEEAKQAISSSGGAIINHQLFSDVSISLNIEINEYEISELEKSLSRVISLSRDEGEQINHASKKEAMVLINISFSQSTGNLKTDIPEVPG